MTPTIVIGVEQRSAERARIGGELAAEIGALIVVGSRGRVASGSLEASH